MSNLMFYPAFVASVVSIFGLMQIAVRHHDKTLPRSLSELAAAEQRLLVRFRSILIICGVLFALTVFGFIMPRVQHSELIMLFGSLMVGGELIAAVLPARRKTLLAHSIMAQLMAVGMLGLAISFMVDVGGIYRWLEAACVLLMSIFAAATLLHKRRFILYELAFIFTSHLSILLVAIAVR